MFISGKQIHHAWNNTKKFFKIRTTKAASGHKPSMDTPSCLEKVCLLRHLPYKIWEWGKLLAQLLKDCNPMTQYENKSWTSTSEDEGIWKEYRKQLHKNND